MLGRFTSPDSIVQFPQNIASFNRYSYVANNPILYVDPSGNSFECGIYPGTSCAGVGPTTPVIVYDEGGHSEAAEKGITSEELVDNFNNFWNSLVNTVSIFSDPVDVVNSGKECLEENCSPFMLLSFLPVITGHFGKELGDLATKAFNNGGQEALERFLRKELGQNADDVLRVMKNGTFENETIFKNHVEGHLDEFMYLGYKTEDDYLNGARNLFMGGDDVESFVRKRDGMIEFYRESTNEYGVISPDGIIQTYYPPKDEIEYWWRQMERNK